MRNYFPYETEAATFNDAVTRAFVEIQKQIVAQYLPPQNTQRFRHGGAWRNPGNTEAIGGQIQTHSMILETRFDDIIKNDLAVIERNFNQVREAMHQQFAQMLYSAVGEACNQSGNIVDARATGSLAEAFVAALEKIEFGIDKDGTVHIPEFHVSPEFGGRMIAALEGTSQEFQDRIEVLKAQKTAEALAREAERKTKFVCYGPDPCAS
jgi:hypothetical protein